MELPWRTAVLLKMECDITPFGCRCDGDDTDVIDDAVPLREKVTAVEHNKSRYTYEGYSSP